jgi:MoxR-like ATPase
MLQSIAKDFSPPTEALSRAREFLSQRLLGQTEIVDLALSALLAGGHLLLEGPPGVGKTTLARSLAEVFGGKFKRIQLTSDLLPSEIVGVLRPTSDGRDFEFREGPVFSNFLLADELNRTGPKTQAALLEAMAEGTVSVDGKTYRLPDPFFVVATQNPLEYQGVYPLAESQLDRFMLELRLPLPPEKAEFEIYKNHQGIIQVNEDRIEPILPVSGIAQIRAQVGRVFIEESLLQYAFELIQATRSQPEVSYGVSVRGGLQYLQAVRAYAYLKGRAFVLPEDLRALATPALAHRLRLDEGDLEGSRKIKLVESILEKVRAPQ